MPSDAQQSAPLLRYLEAMLEENQRVNLTAIRDPEAARVLHVEDSVAVAALSLAPRTCLDLGSGNGFPGVALALLYPQATVTLLDRTAKKLRAVERALATAGLSGIRTLHADAAQLPALDPAMRHAFDLIAARAVGPPERVASLAEALLAPDGDLVLWLDAETPAPESIGRLRRRALHHYELPEPAARQRRLGVWRRRR